MAWVREPRALGLGPQGPVRLIAGIFSGDPEGSGPVRLIGGIFSSDPAGLGPVRLIAGISSGDPERAGPVRLIAGIFNAPEGLGPVRLIAGIFKGLSGIVDGPELRAEPPTATPVAPSSSVGTNANGESVPIKGA